MKFDQYKRGVKWYTRPPAIQNNTHTHTFSHCAPMLFQKLPIHCIPHSGITIKNIPKSKKKRRERAESRENRKTYVCVCLDVFTFAAKNLLFNRVYDISVSTCFGMESLNLIGFDFISSHLAYVCNTFHYLDGTQ